MDRSAAYACRHIAKNIVGANLAKSVLFKPPMLLVCVQLDGQPLWNRSVSSEALTKAVNQVWSLKPADIIQQFDLLKPRYRKTAAYGHFGRYDTKTFTWEKLDRVEELKDVVKVLS